MNGEQYPNWTIQFQEKLGHECGRSAGFVLPGGREHALRLVVSKKKNTRARATLLKGTIPKKH